MLWTKTWKSGSRWQQNKGNRKRKPFIWLLALSLLVLLSGCENPGSGLAERQGQDWVLEEQSQTEETDQEIQEQTGGSLRVDYLDVGQGNAILVRSEGENMLIDGGPRESSSFVVSYLKQQGIEKLDYMLISHFDEDHLAGAVGALYNFPVETLITPDYETDSSIYDSYKEGAAQAGCQALHPALNQEFPLGSSSFRIISPTAYGHRDENQDSVGILLENGGDSFFIGGDIGLEGEKEILEAGVDIQAEVMLMNHHGSHVSREFFQAVDPDYAVISCGEGNSYGHPRQDTVELLEEFQIPLYRTDKQGTIIAVSTGDGITFSQEPSGDYTPGEGAKGKEDQPEETRESLSNSSIEECEYILNMHTKKIHLPDCSSVKSMDEDNKAYYKGEETDLLNQGYTPCGNCMKK